MPDGLDLANKPSHAAVPLSYYRHFLKKSENRTPQLSEFVRENPRSSDGQYIHLYTPFLQDTGLRTWLARRFVCALAFRAWGREFDPSACVKQWLTLGCGLPQIILTEHRIIKG